MWQSEQEPATRELPIQNNSGFVSNSTGMFSLVTAQLAAKELPGVTLKVVHAHHRLSSLG
jgi:hypothetical protein